MTRSNPDRLRIRKRWRFVVVTLLIVLASTIAAFANPSISARWQYYEVTATTADGMQAQKLPHRGSRVWGVTRWEVVWTNSCRVSIDITYIIPQHTRRGAMSPHMRARWDAMIAALRTHEQRHGHHAISAGRELVQNKCRNARAIIRKWEEQDVLYDRSTGHGRTEGVIFP